jgi:uncharacterized membrane protein (DUF373 family)
VGEHPPSREPRPLGALIDAAQGGLYLVIGALLLLAAAVIVVGTVREVIEGSGSRPITDTGLFVLERVLLMFIIAELLVTLRLVDLRGRILVEPFLFIGLIAVVRRVLVLMAEAEDGNRVENNEFLIQIGALGGLALVLALAIHLLRRSDPARRLPQDGGG